MDNLSYAEGKKADKRRVHTKGFHLYKILENTNHSDKQQSSGCLCKGMGRNRRECSSLGTYFGKLLGVMDVFTILTVVMVLWVCTSVNIYQIVHFKRVVYCMSVMP